MSLEMTAVVHKIVDSGWCLLFKVEGGTLPKNRRPVVLLRKIIKGLLLPCFTPKLMM
jgi:hypothetical protein